MRVEFEDQAVFLSPLASVQALLCNPDFAPRKYLALGHEDVVVTRLEDMDDSFEIECIYKSVQGADMPVFLRKFFRSNLRASVRHSYAVSRSCLQGRIKIEVKQMPLISIDCAFSLHGDDQVTYVEMRWSVGCSLPLVGASVSQFICNDIRKKSVDDTRVTTVLLRDMTA